METTMNEYQAEMMDDLRKEDELAEHEMTPAEHWGKIKEIAKSLENDVKDLQDLLKDFNKSATIPF